MIKNCPKCNGSTGFALVKTVRSTEIVGWDGFVLDISGVDLYENKKIRCSDCNCLLEITAEIKQIIKNRNG